MAQLKDLLVEGKSRFIDKIYASDQFISKVVQGTPPFLIDSSTLVSNLNADLLDGVHESSFFRYRGNIDASYVDLTNYAANADGYQNPLNGIYSVQRNNHSCSLIAFTGAGSASGLDVYFHYSKGGEFKFRRRIDNNRLSGAWETFITDQNFSSYLGYIGTTAVQASQLDGQNITGIGTILWPGATKEILRFSANNSTWYSGLKYSWSSNTTVALWGKHANTQFVWHAGTDFTANDVNGTSNRGYDFQVGRIDNNLEVRSSGIMNAAAFVEHNSTPTNVFLLKPKSATYITTTSSVTGAITITLPASIGNTMTSMWIDVYLYSTNKSFSVHVGGYTYNNSTWANNPFAMVYGAEWTVRLGHNGTNFIIYIGETNTSWAYPQVAVRDVICGYGPSSANWEKDFAISFSTSFSNVTATITNYALTTKNILLDNVLTLKAGAYTADATWTYPGGSYASVKYPNMRLIGDPTYGLSTIEFISQKGDTTINKPTDCAFIQFQPYGVTTQTAIGTQPTLASSGEANRLVIGVNNDSNDSLILQTPATTGLKHAVGTGLYTIWDSGNDGSGSGLDADTVDGIHGTDFVEKRYGRFYPFVKSDSTRSVWHKVTFPHTGYTSTSNAWFMLTMEIVLSGSYQNAAAGKIFLNYYFLKDSSNNWSAVTVKGVAIGTHITSSGVKIRYDIANPAIFYIKVSTYNYTSFAIENLSANDTAQNYDYRNTTIETIAEADIPSAADKYIPIAVIESNDGSTLIATNLTSDVAKRLAQSPISSLSTFTHTTDLIYTARGGGNSITDKPTNVDAFGVITMKTADGWYGQLLMSANSASGIYWRTGTSLSGGWKQLIDTSNYTSYLGYIGTTPVQASSAAQAVTGITALTFNGATSAGTNYITGTAGRIYFGGNFHLDSLGSNATYINYYTGNNVYLVSGSTQGKVGIGTSSPTEKLEVSGNIRVLNPSDNQVIARFLNYSTSPYGLMIKSYTNGSLHLQSQRESNNSEVFPLLLNPNGGNIGIGTTAPENKLDVNGIASIYPRGADNTAFKGNLIIKQQNSAEDTGQGYTGSKPSFGIQFNRFWTNSSGAYGETKGAGIFATVSSSWRGGLVFRTKDNQTQGGTHDTNALRLRPDGNAVFAGGVGSPGTNGNVTGSYIAYPKGGCYATNTSSVTGYLKITLPQKGKNTMMSFDVTIYTYDGANQSYTTYHISGYEYSTNGWYNPVTKVYSEGIGPYTNLTVRLGNDGTYACVTIGEANTVWTYPQVTVHNIMTGYSGCDVDTWIGGWAVGFTTTALTTVVSEKTAVNTQNINVSGSAGSVAWGNITGKPSSFTPADHNHDGRYLQYNGWWTSGNGNNADNANGMVFAYSNHNVPTGWGILTTFDYQYNSSYKMQLFSYGYTNGYTYYRNRSADRNGWNPWVRFLDSTNYTEYLTDTKVTQTKTSSSNTSWRPLIIGSSYSDATTFNPSTVTDITYATHLAKFKPSTGQLAIGGLYKMNTNGTVATGANDEVWNTNGTTVKISTLFTTEPEYLTLEVKNATSPSTPITEYVGVTITNKFTNETIYDGIVYQNTHLVPGTSTYTTNPIEIPPGIEYVVSCSYITGYAAPDPGIFLSIPGYSRILTLNFIPVRVDILSIDFTKGDAPSAFLTYTPASGTSVVQWIRNNSHRYAAYFAKLSNTITDGNGNLLTPRGAQMYICQLKDSDSTRFANDNSYLYPTDASVENGDIYMRLPKFYYRVTGNSTTFTVEFADVNPNQPGFQEWDSNNMIAVYPSSYRTGILMNNSSSTKIDAYISSPYFENSTISSNDICLNVSSCKLSSATISSSGTTVDKFAGGLDKASIKNMYPNIDVKFLRYKWVQILRLLFMAYYQTTDCVSVCGTGRRSGVYTPSAQGTQGRGMTDTTSSTGNDKPVNFWGVESLWGISSIYSDVAWQYYHLNSNANNVNKLGLLADNVPIPDLLSSGDVVYKFGSVPSSSDLYYGRTVSILPGTPTTTEQKLTYSPVGFSYNTGGSATSRWFSSYNLNTAMSTGYTYNGFVLYGANSLFQEGAYRTAASGFARICYYGPIQEVYSPTVFYNSIKPNSAIYRRLRGNTAIPAG